MPKPDKLQLNLDAKSAQLLRYLLGNGVANIETRDELDTWDKAALELASKLTATISKHFI